MPADVLQCHLRLTPWKSAHNLGLARARPNYLLLLLIVFFLCWWLAGVTQKCMATPFCLLLIVVFALVAGRWFARGCK